MALPPTPEQVERSRRLVRLHAALGSLWPCRRRRAAAALVADGEVEALACALGPGGARAAAVREALANALGAEDGADLAWSVLVRSADEALARLLQARGVRSDAEADAVDLLLAPPGPPDAPAADAPAAGPPATPRPTGPASRAGAGRLAAWTRWIAAHHGVLAAPARERILAGARAGDAALARDLAALAVRDDPGAVFARAALADVSGADARDAVAGVYLALDAAAARDALAAWGHVPRDAALAAHVAHLRGEAADPVALGRALAAAPPWQRRRAARRARGGGPAAAAWVEAVLEAVLGPAPTARLEARAAPGPPAPGPGARLGPDERLDPEEAAAVAALAGPDALRARPGVLRALPAAATRDLLLRADAGVGAGPDLAALARACGPAAPLGGWRRVVTLTPPEGSAARGASLARDGTAVAVHLTHLGGPGNVRAWRVDVAAGRADEVAVHGDHACLASDDGGGFFVAHRRTVERVAADGSGARDAPSLEATRDVRSAIERVFLLGDGELLAAWTNDPVLRVWRARSGEPVATLDPLRPPPGGVPLPASPPPRASSSTRDGLVALAACPVRGHLAALSYDALAVWDLARDQLLLHRAQAGAAVALEPGGDVVVVVGLDGTVRRLRYPGGDELSARALPEPPAAAPPSHGSMQELAASLLARARPPSWAGAAPGPDGAWLVRSDGAVFAGDAALGRCPAAGDVVAASPDARFLLFASAREACLLESLVARLAWTPPAAFGPADHELLASLRGGARGAPPLLPGDRAWLDLVAALVER